MRKIFIISHKIHLAFKKCISNFYKFRRYFTELTKILRIEC